MNLNMNKTPMGKTADAFRKFGWALVAAGSFSITAAPDEKHLTHGVWMWGVCQITGYLIDEIDRAFGPGRKH